MHILSVKNFSIVKFFLPLCSYLHSENMHCIFFFNELLFLSLFRHTSLDGSVKRAKRSKELSLFCGQNGYIPRKSGLLLKIQRNHLPASFTGPE